MSKELHWSQPLNAIPEFALMISSSFFTALLFTTLLANRYVQNAEIMFYISAVVFFIYTSFARKNNKVHQIVWILGSIVFFIFLVSYFLFPDSSFGTNYHHYKQIFELALNWGVIVFLGPIVILLLVVSIIYRFIQWVSKKSKRDSPALFAQVFIIVLFSSMLVISFIPLVWPQVDPAKLTVRWSRYLIPFLGFSLVYLHGSILAKGLLSLFKTNQ